MASPLFPALAAGALLALLAQIPPSLNAAPRWLPVGPRTAAESPGQGRTGGPRHAAPRVLHRPHTVQQASAIPLRPPGKAPRRPWGFSGPAQASGLSPQSPPAPTTPPRTAQR